MTPPPSRHQEMVTTFTDMTGRDNRLGEGCCISCGERWPCTTEKLRIVLTAAQHAIAACPRCGGSGIRFGHYAGTPASSPCPRCQELRAAVQATGGGV